MTEYDVIIVGGGLGGLACGSILSKEGLKICVLEQAGAIGGCLQSFSRHGHFLDTGMHFVGSLSEGQIMRQFFRYFGIEKKLKLKKLDEDAFDVVSFTDGKSYRLASGYDRFIDTLTEYFPDDRKSIRDYCAMLQKIGGQISTGLLKDGRLSSDSISYMCMSAYDEIMRVVGNPVLRNVLCGNNSYDKIKDKTSLYEHCIINHSNIEGSYRFVGNSQQIVDAFVEVIKSNGGEIFPSSRVTKFYLNDKGIESVEVNHSRRFYAKSVISSIHPVITYSLLESNSYIRKAFLTRLKTLDNSYGLFTTYMVMKPGTFRYINKNLYLYNTHDTWATDADYKGINLTSLLMSMQPVENSDYADVVSLIMPVWHNEFDKWADSSVGSRPQEYKEFRQKVSEVMIDFVSQWIPSISSCIDKVYTATPLTYKDYTLTPRGSAYGIIKDFHNPVISHLPVQTRIPNLFLTGQNINLHGCLGVSMTAALTCGQYLGLENLAKKIGNA